MTISKLKKIYDINNPIDLLDFINSNLAPKTFEKNQYGEVFTPLNLVNEMLDTLPKSVWKNKELKWLDPAVGIGNFPIVIYLRLMEGLKNEISNEENRRKHILENMIYMVELNGKNVRILKKILCFKEYKLNIFEGSFIEGEYKKIYKTDIKFDIIVGNPPYNKGQNNEGKKGGGDPIWNKFVVKSLKDFLNDNGYLMFIHPSGWRKPDSETSKYTGLYDLMTKENQMIYLEIHNSEDGNKIFNCGTRFDWYLINKKLKNEKTKIKDENGIIKDYDLSKIPFLPNYNINKIIKLLGKKEKCEILYNRTNYGSDQKYVSETKTDKFKYPLIHSTPQNGIRYMYSSRNDLGHFGISKVIFGETGIYNSIIDKKGKYGMTNGCMAIVENKNNLEDIKKCLESDKFKEILNACSWSNYRIEWRLFSYLRKDFYKHFI